MRIRTAALGVFGASALAVAALGVGPTGVGAVTLRGTCATIGTFDTPTTEFPTDCTVLAGETITFTVKGANGGRGGDGGPGGDGGDYDTNWGGRGGGPGPGGDGGVGAKVTGTWTNSTGATVTLQIVIGVNGLDGDYGAPGSRGSSFPANAVPTNGGPGGAGTDGGAGSSSVIMNGSTPIVVADGGTGGSKGTPGSGGLAANPGGGGAPGNDGTGGSPGDDGVVAFPDTLPVGWTLVTTSINDAPSIIITSTGVEEPTTTTVSAGPATTIATDPVTPTFTG